MNFLIRYKDDVGTIWIEPFKSLEHYRDEWRVNGRNVEEGQYANVKAAITNAMGYADCIDGGWQGGTKVEMGC